MSLASASSKQPPLDTLIEEERKDDYDPRHFFPVNLGQVFCDTYRVVTKLGYGGSSTVWLAKDIRRRPWQSTRYVALKICTNNHADQTSASHELQISQVIATANPSHPGRQFVRTIVDSFEAKGPHGSHMCLVYEPMREPIWLLQQRFNDGRYSSDLLKLTLQYLLSGIDYLHSECHIIHTDIKPENILIRLENPSVLDDVAKGEAEKPSLRKVLDDRIVYLSRNNFGHPKSSPGKPVITDFDTATRGNVSHPLTHPIQPNPYRSPEVTLGAPWTYSADIWNFGVMIWDLLEGKKLCDGFDPEYNKYTSCAHLAQLIALCGCPPKELLDRGKLTSRWFESNGVFKRQNLIPQGITLENSINMEGEDKKLFIEFVRKMLQWLPENRSTAKELLADPWLNHFS